MPGIKPDIYQPIAGIGDLRTLGDIQDHNNRRVFDFLTRVSRMWPCNIRDPGVSDDLKDGYVPPAMWTNTATNSTFILSDNAAGAAVWTQITSGGVPVVATSTILSNGSATGVASTTQTTVDTYTASGSDVKLSKIIVTGDANATWSIEIDSVEKIEWRAADGNKTRDFDFSSPLVLANGSTIDIKVEHFFTAETANFKATILGYT